MSIHEYGVDFRISLRDGVSLGMSIKLRPAALTHCLCWVRRSDKLSGSPARDLSISCGSWSRKQGNFAVRATRLSPELDTPERVGTPKRRIASTGDCPSSTSVRCSGAMLAGDTEMLEILILDVQRVLPLGEREACWSIT